MLRRACRCRSWRTRVPLAGLLLVEERGLVWLRWFGCAGALVLGVALVGLVLRVDVRVVVGLGVVGVEGVFEGPAAAVADGGPRAGGTGALVGLVGVGLEQTDVVGQVDG